MRVRATLLAAVLLTCASTGRSQTGLNARVYAAGFASPIAIVQDPANRSVQFVVEQTGRIRVVRAGDVLGDFLDLRNDIRAGGEQGLLGLAFAPDSVTTGRFFVNFTNRNGDTVVARFVRSANPLQADPASRFDLKWGPEASPVIAQPYTNHNGGHLAFGSDGYLYIGLGDGGSGNDPDNRAQSPSEWLGKMLRVDVAVPATDAAGYRVPADNPFVTSGPPRTRPEIWSFGLRNPWRYSFDAASLGGTGALIIGDVGQSAFEEVDWEPAKRGGRNYGWRIREGAHDNITTPGPAYLPLTDPMIEYGRNDGFSITGGYVYRGKSLGAAYTGRYFYADYGRGRIWSVALTLDGNGEASASDRVEHTAELGGTGILGNISSFGLDADGELFLVNYTGSIVSVYNASAAPATPTGLHIIKP